MIRTDWTHDKRRGGVTNHGQNPEPQTRPSGKHFFRSSVHRWYSPRRQFWYTFKPPSPVEEVTALRTYNLQYYDEQRDFKSVQFVSYIWKFIDGLIHASLKKELLHERFHDESDWERLTL